MNASTEQIINGRYQLRRKLGEGAFGQVFHAEHLAFGTSLREVAVKISKKPLTDTEARHTFADAFLLARLTDQCPDSTVRQHFVTLYDAGRCDTEGQFKDHALTVMEYVSTGNLANRLRAGPFPLTRVIKYMEQILKAVAFMHQGIIDSSGRHQPIIHRDLKPGNILVAVVGTNKEPTEIVKLTDFGLAVAVDNLLGWTEAGGTLSYWAPESLPHGYSSPASDVYALGLLCYEMLTGTNPFAPVGLHLSGSDEQKQQELARLHLRARERESFPGLQRQEELQDKPALVHTIRKALAFCADQRYTDARMFYAEFQQALKNNEGKVDLPLKLSTPKDEVKKLVRKARQCLFVGEIDRALDLANQAMEINRDKRRVPDLQIVGEAYELIVQLKIKQGPIEEAGRLAAEGYNRRRCQGTCRAMGWYYQACQSPTAISFFEEAKQYPPEV
jgi:serine/threonine protein kinase